MAHQPGQMDRREFLKSGLQVATGAALIGSGVACGAVRPPKRISLVGSLATRIERSHRSSNPKAAGTNVPAAFVFILIAKPED